jgi:hypothetical protein
MLRNAPEHHGLFRPSANPVSTSPVISPTNTLHNPAQNATAIPSKGMRIAKLRVDSAAVLETHVLAIRVDSIRTRRECCAWSGMIYREVTNARTEILGSNGV